jgi:hypothetical protein
MDASGVPTLKNCRDINFIYKIILLDIVLRPFS